MRIDERPVGDVTVLDVTGRITADAGDVELKDKINSLLNQGRSKILLNLGGVAFVDSTGLGQIVASFTSVSNNKGQMKLLNVTKRLNDLLIITKLTNVFDTFDDESEALKSFKWSGGGGDKARPAHQDVVGIDAGAKWQLVDHGSHCHVGTGHVLLLEVERPGPLAATLATLAEDADVDPVVERDLGLNAFAIRAEFSGLRRHRHVVTSIGALARDSGGRLVVEQRDGRKQIDRAVVGARAG